MGDRDLKKKPGKALFLGRAEINELDQDPVPPREEYSNRNQERVA